MKSMRTKSYLSYAAIVIAGFCGNANAQTTLNPTADTYVRSGVYANSAFGAASVLQLKKSSSPTDDFNREIWLKFDTAGVAGSVATAKLRLFGSLNHYRPRTGSIFSSTNTAWQESALTWISRPPSDTVAHATATISQSNSWNEWDVTSYLQSERAAGRRVVTLIVRVNQTSSALGSFYSKENGSANKPRLEITTVPSGSKFQTLPPGSALPSAAECALRVRQNNWEPRPENEPENSTPGGAGHQATLPEDTWVGFDSWRRWYNERVRGDFTGQTDELIQWASCKWGFDEDTTRAVAINESFWSQEQFGDGGQSVGILQVKSRNPDTNGPGGPHWYTYPDSRNSTAYNLDYALGWRRACYEGYFAEGGWLPPASRGDFDGCVGLWFSGEWHTNDEQYVESYRRHLQEKPWTTWPGWPGP